MKILVTGGTGFLGRHLAQRLVKQGHEVTITGRNITIGQTLEQTGLKFQAAQLEDANRIIPLCQNIDVVFHCGALSSPWGRYQDFYAANVIGTQNVIAGCQQYGVSRLIYVSTPSLYFDFQNRLNISEQAPLPAKPVNYYAKTKLQAEALIDQAFRDCLPVITIRPRAIFGPYDNAIMPRILRASRGGRVPLINGGKAVVDLTYVDNVVDALLLCQNAPDIALGKKYNITNGEPLAVKEILALVFKALELPYHPRRIPYPLAYTAAFLMEIWAHHREPTLTRYSVGVLGKSQTLDISAAQRELGYQPRVSILEGIKRYAQWYKQSSQQ